MSNTATVSITVAAVNDPPVANNDAYSTNEDTALTVAAPGVLANDTAVEGSLLSAVLVAGPSKGTLTLGTDGSFTYVPNSHANGSDSFTYGATDGTAMSNTATVAITINPINDAPVANDDLVKTQTDVPVTIQVLANDFDVDGDQLFVTSLAQPVNGTVVLNVDQTVTYTPNPGFSGQDSFTFAASDGVLVSNSAKVTISVEKPTMHVGDLDGSKTNHAETWTATSNVAIDNAAHGPVAEAAVTVSWQAYRDNGSINGAPSGTLTCTTGSNGSCAVSSSPAENSPAERKYATVVFTVTGVSHTTFGYHPADNHDSDGDSNGTSITVTKP